MSNILILVTTDHQNRSERCLTIDCKPDLYDCYDYIYAFREYGDELFLADWQSWNGSNFGRVWHDNKKEFINIHSLEFFDAIWVYKTREYFNEINKLRDMLRYLKTLPLLIINDPDTIEHNINKSYLWELESLGVDIVPTFVINQQNISKISSNNHVIIKPRAGAFGYKVFSVESPEQFYQLGIVDYESFILQPLISEVKNGEISLVFLGLEYQHCFVRIPAKGTFLCNMAHGSEIKAYQPSQKIIDFGKKVLSAYQNLGYKIFISRIDLFETPGGYLLSEAELFNPTLAGYYSEKLQFSKKVVQLFHRSLTDASYGKY